MITEFYHAKTGQGYWMTGEVPDVDLLDQPVFVIFDMDSYIPPRSLWMTWTR